MPIAYQACNGVHTLKREHLDEEGEKTLFDADNFDLLRSGYVPRKLVESALLRMEVAPCACQSDEHDDACPVAIAIELMERFDHLLDEAADDKSESEFPEPGDQPAE